ncbi:GNAT family N-acetyltransferase [Rhodococcus wratislaviensis]|uniref:GNAT family N-acetyltransferase n=1 Tax=Rhodococcus wratislaviensis TaxID=44752 RepID=UPI003518996B
MHQTHVAGEGEAATEVTIRPLGAPGDLGWVIQANGEVYANEFGWDSGIEVLVAQLVAEYARNHDEREAAWIAELDGARVGCVFCTHGDDDVSAKLRVLVVDPKARGHAVGRRLVHTCVDFARQAGYRRIGLWTVDTLSSARRIYQAAGFELDSETSSRLFGQDLVEQCWSREL